MTSVYTKPLAPELWQDFVAYFEYKGRCSGCWCMNHRMPMGLDVTGEAAKLAMQQLIESHRVFGVLAYAQGDEVPVGWLALDRKNSLPGHDCIGMSPADATIWSIHCVSVRSDYRQQGVERLLIQAGTDLAADYQGQAIEAYPEPNSSENTPFTTWNSFNGYANIYADLGYHPQKIQDAYCIVQRPIATHSENN